MNRRVHRTQWAEAVERLEFELPPLSVENTTGFDEFVSAADAQPRRDKRSPDDANRQGRAINRLMLAIVPSPQVFR